MEGRFMEKKRFLSALVSLCYYIRYEVNYLLGRTAHTHHVTMDSRFLALTRKLQQSFDRYDPVDRDFVKSLLERKHITPPANLNHRSAACATHALMLIELMHQGKLPPDCFTPLIEPWQIPYYYRRMQAYLEMLLSEDRREQRIPVPFFHMIAAERMFQLLRIQEAQAKAAAEQPVSKPKTQPVPASKRIAFVLKQRPAWVTP